MSRGTAPRPPRTGRAPAPARRTGALALLLSLLVGLVLASAAHASSGEVVAWGENSLGELGDGTTTPFTEQPVAVCAPTYTGLGNCPASEHLKKVKAISAGGEHSLALLINGTVLAWGTNEEGALGDGVLSGGFSDVPVLVCEVGWTPGTKCPAGHELKEVLQISAGDKWSNIALLKSGKVVTWGSNASGQLGEGSFSPPYSPVPVYPCAAGVNVDNVTCPGGPYLTGVERVSAAPAHDVAILKVKHEAVAWGANQYGQVGHKFWTSSLPTGTNRAEAVCAVEEAAGPPCPNHLKEVLAVSFGLKHNVALIQAKLKGVKGKRNEIVAFGEDAFGQLGVASPGGPETCGNTVEPCSTVPVYVCETNYSGSGPCPTTQLGEAMDVGAGGSHSLALLSSGQVRAWGENTYGSLGNNETSTREVPVPVCELGFGPPSTPCPSANYLTGISAISAGGFHNLALTTTGEVDSWGEDASGQLGDGSTVNSPVPVRVCEGGWPGTGACPLGSHLTKVKAVSAGLYHSLALVP